MCGLESDGLRCTLSAGHVGEHNAWAHAAPSQPSPAVEKLQGGPGPDFVTRAELVRLLREAADSYLQNPRDAFKVLAAALEHEGK